MALKLFWIFFKLGLFCFGGGNAMIGVLERQLVTELHFITNAQFADMIAISQITPGPIAINLATYVGTSMGNGVGESIFYGMVATFAVCLPAFAIVIIIAKFFRQFGNSKAVINVMGGIKPGVIGLIAGSVLLLCRLSLYDADILKTGDILHAINFSAVGLCILAFIVATKTKINPILVLIGSGLLGILIF